MATIAILLSAGFDDGELEVPCDALREAGHRVVFAGSEAGEMESHDGEVSVTVDVAFRDLDVDAVDALLLVGGASHDGMADEAATGLILDAVDCGKLVAAACRGSRLLAAAGVVRSVEVTSFPDLQAELEEAGARWVDRAVVEDGNFITSRQPADLDHFSRVLVARLSDEVQSAPASLHF